MTSFTKMQNTFQQKDYSISILRIIAMLMVTLFHCICYYTNNWDISYIKPIKVWCYLSTWLYNIELPLFVYISGYLFAYLFRIGKYQIDKRINIFSQKIKRLFFPYILWGCGLCLIFHERYEWNLFTGISHLWFLIMLFYEFAIALISVRLWNKLKVKQSVLFLLLIQTIIIIIYPFLFNTKFSYLNIVLKYLPFFYLGFLVAKSSLIEKIKYPTISFIFFVLLYTVFSFMSTNKLYTFLYQLIIYMCIVNLHAVLYNIKSCNSLLLSLDKCAMGIYILHHIFIYDLIIRYDRFRLILDTYPILAPIILFIIILPLSWFLTNLIIRSKFNFILG